MDDHHFLIIVPVDFRFLPDLIHRHPTVEFKPIIITSAIILFLAEVRAVIYMVAEGIGEQILVGSTCDIMQLQRIADKSLRLFLRQGKSCFGGCHA